MRLTKSAPNLKGGSLGFGELAQQLRVFATLERTTIQFLAYTQWLTTELQH